MSRDLKTIHLACLCAAWCRLCDDYQPLFERLGREIAAVQPGLRLRWIDIEDEADLVGSLDVQTFPTLVIVGPEGVRFAGPLTPQEDTLRRLLRHTVLEADRQSSWPVVAPEISAFAGRLIQR